MENSHKLGALVVLVLIVLAVLYWRSKHKAESFGGVSFNRDYDVTSMSSGDRF